MENSQIDTHFTEMYIHTAMHAYIQKQGAHTKNHETHIQVENSQIDTYFTEKLLDCFLTGTVPIYWGAQV